jgi:hypothetical protein
MHTCNCQLSIGGDPLNQLPLLGVTVPELILLQLIHGPNAVVEIEIKGKDRTDNMGERDRLIAKYPKHREKVINMWRDNAGRLPADIRDLKLPASSFKASLADAYAPADKLTKARAAELKKAATVLPDSDPADVTVDDDPPGDLEIY